MRIKLMVISSLVAFSLLAVTLEDKEKLKVLDDFANQMQVENSGSKTAKVQQEDAEAEAKSLVNKAFLDERFDTDGSLLAVLAKDYMLVPGVWNAIDNVIKTTDSPIRKQRILNFMVLLSYNGALEGKMNMANVGAWVERYDDPSLYSEVSKRRVKKLILERYMSPLYADVLNISQDKEIQVCLKELSQEGKYDSTEGFVHEAWTATCMLAKQGDKEALDLVGIAAKNLTDFHLMWFIPAGMGYIGTEEMASLLFEMLNSDLRRTGGSRPKEIQLAHQAAVALSYCVEGFPEYGLRVDFTAADKKRCLDWVKENKDKFKLKKKPAVFFLKETQFD